MFLGEHDTNRPRFGSHDTPSHGGVINAEGHSDVSPALPLPEKGEELLISYPPALPPFPGYRGGVVYDHGLRKPFVAKRSLSSGGAILSPLLPKKE